MGGELSNVHLLDSGGLHRAVRAVAGACARWVWLEVLLVFVIFALQGAWPVPDVNEPYYLGKAVHYWNPSWGPQDDFLATRDAHWVFYFTYGWLSLWLPLPALAWLGRALTWWLLAWGWVALSRAAAPKPGLAVLTGAVFACCLDYGPMAGEWVIGGVEAKGFAYAAMLFALAELWRGRWNRVWILLGIASAFHVLVGGWSVLAAGFAWLTAGRERPPWYHMLPGLLVGGILALPGLLPSLALTQGVAEETVRLANRIYVYRRLPHHLVPGAFPWNHVVCFLLLTAFFVGLARLAPSDAPSRRLRQWVLATVLIAAVGGLISLAIPYAPDVCASLLRFYWFRLADTAVPLGVALFAGLVLAGEAFTRARYRQIFAATLAVVAGLHVGTYAVLRPIPTVPRAEFSSPFTMTPEEHDWAVRRYVTWRIVCDWIADPENTPPDARFLTPRMSTTFKWYTGRSEVATWKEIPQDAESIVNWWDKLCKIYLVDDPVWGLQWCGSLSELGEERLIALCREYDADYIVTTRSHQLDLEVAFYQLGNPYVVYRPQRSRRPAAGGSPTIPIGPGYP